MSADGAETWERFLRTRRNLTLPLSSKRQRRRVEELPSLTSIPVKEVEQLNLEIISKYIKSRSANLIAFYKVTTLVDGGKAVDAVYFDFSKAFDNVSHNSS